MRFGHSWQFDKSFCSFDLRRRARSDAKTVNGQLSVGMSKRETLALYIKGQDVVISWRLTTTSYLEEILKLKFLGQDKIKAPTLVIEVPPK